MAPLCKGSCRRSGLSGCFSLRSKGELRSPLTPHRNAPSEHSGVPVGFFFEKAMLWPFLQNARPSGSLRSPSVCAPNQLFELLRCSAWLIHDFAPSPMRALVFRSAYSASRNARASAAFAASIKAHCAVGTETLMLQVRSAHPPMPHRNDPSGHSGVPLGLFGKPKRSSSSRFAASGGRGELRSPLHPPLPPPRILERQTGTPFGLYSAKGASLPSQRLRGCPLPLPLPLCYHKHK